MKRLFVAAIIFLFIVTICFAGNYALLKKLNGFKSRIEECRRLYNAGEIESAQKCVEAFKEDWYKTSKTVSAFANHRAIDEIGVLVSA
ncbi:MAG: DUF4363 family protein, partial [Clostridia bacterium]|nr:DUF4363 family protein [Clostridia bacterium]